MRRVPTLALLALALVLCARAARLAAEDRPTILFADLNEKKEGTWVYVASADNRKVGRLTITVAKDEVSQRESLKEVEERACTLGKMSCTRDYVLERGLEFAVMTSKMEAKFGGYGYEDEFVLGPDASSTTKGVARIKAGMLVEYTVTIPALPATDPLVQDADLKNPFFMMGVVRLLPRLAVEQPGYHRTFLLADIPEPRAKSATVMGDLALERNEDIQILGKPASCEVFTLKGGTEVVGEYWRNKKGEIVQFTEKTFIHGNTLETKYTLATPQEAQAAFDEAAKWGADPKDPQATAMAWLKEVIKGDAAGVAKVTDQAAVDAAIAAIANENSPPQDKDRQAKIKAAAVLPALTKMFKTTPSEQIFRYVYIVRDDPKGGVNVYLPAMDGNCILHLTKGGDPAAPDVWKVTGITPPL